MYCTKIQLALRKLKNVECLSLNPIALIKTLYTNLAIKSSINFTYPPLTLKNYVWKIIIGRSLRMRLPKSTPKESYPRVLLVCSYRPDEPNLIEALIKSIKEARSTKIDLVLNNYGNFPASPVELPFVKYTMRKPKFQNVPEMIKNEFRPCHDYVMIIDDDVLLPKQFFDEYFNIVKWLGLKLSQPALTRDSFWDHPCTLQISGEIAHLTSFVEIGPVTCFSKEMVEILPFEDCSPMGYGLDLVWSRLCRDRRWSMGVIDCTLVRHRLRPIAKAYDTRNEIALMKKYLSGKPHVPIIATEIVGQIFWQEELPLHSLMCLMQDSN